MAHLVNVSDSIQYIFVFFVATYMFYPVHPSANFVIFMNSFVSKPVLVKKIVL